MGSIALFKKLQELGHSIYIYTTFFRSVIKIKLTIFRYGIPIERVINQEVHDKVLRNQKTRSSKYPPAFGIDIHVDDSPGLKIEGDRFNFATLIIKENDQEWEGRVLEAINSYQNQ